MIDDLTKRKIFYCLKRASSYTAWKRAAEAYGEFAKQLEHTYSVIAIPEDSVIFNHQNLIDVLQGVVNYERGLAGLLAGDRSVFRWSSIGYLTNTYGSLGVWAKYLDTDEYILSYVSNLDVLQSTLRHATDKSYDKGFVEPGMIDLPAPWFYGDWLKDEFAKYPIPADLPPVPPVNHAVHVKSRDVVPITGIYEPETLDGCMNYLIAGAPAPLYETATSDNSFVVSWSLVWEDTRYQEDHFAFGRIPPEEASYFPADKPAAVATAQPATVMGDMLISDTGQTCPKTGLWSIAERLDVTLSVDQGTEMPQFEGRNVTWVYLRPRV